MALMWNRSVDWDADDWRNLASCRHTSPISSSRSAPPVRPSSRSRRPSGSVTTVGRTNPASSSPSPPTRNQESGVAPPRRSAASSAGLAGRHTARFPDGSISAPPPPTRPERQARIRRGRSATPHPPRSQPDPSDRRSPRPPRWSAPATVPVFGRSALLKTDRDSRKRRGWWCLQAIHVPPAGGIRGEDRVNLDEGLLRGADVLVVDDEPANVALVESILERTASPGSGAHRPAGVPGHGSSTSAPTSSCSTCTCPMWRPRAAP